MSQQILIEELRRKSSDKIKEMWSEAEKKSELLRLEQEREFAHLRKEEDARLQEIQRSAAAPIIHGAEMKARQKIEEALQGLSERLYEMARSRLHRLREKDYPEFFAELVRELPKHDWETVRVNKQDTELARSFFPDAEIESDPAMVGGFVASGDNGRFRVINTLERRLEKSWPYALPEMLRQIIGEKDAVPAA